MTSGASRRVHAEHGALHARRRHEVAGAATSPAISISNHGLCSRENSVSRGVARELLGGLALDDQRGLIGRSRRVQQLAHQRRRDPVRHVRHDVIRRCSAAPSSGSRRVAAATSVVRANRALQPPVQPLVALDGDHAEAASASATVSAPSPAPARRRACPAAAQRDARALARHRRGESAGTARDGDG